MKKQVGTDLVGILWGGCLGYSEVTGNDVTARVVSFHV